MTNKENIVYKNENMTLRGYSQNDHIFKQIKQNNNFYELKLLNKIKSLNLRGTYVDVGANIGNHTLFFSKVCDSEKVVSIEMDKKIFDILSTNVFENNLEEKVFLYNVGVGEKEKKVKTLCPDPNNIGMTKIVGENGDVLVKTLDDLLKNETKITLIKIDVEGYELNVLNGAKNLINKNSPIVIAELKNDYEFIEFEKIMNDLGYYTDKISYASTPTYLWLKKKFDYIYLIPSYNRFEKVKKLIDDIMSLNQNCKIILLNDGSVDINYEIFSTYNKNLVYLKNNKNLGKNNFWITINKLFKKLSEFDFKKCIMLGDDFDLIPKFKSEIEKISNEKDIIRLFTQKNVITNWGYENWVDGALCGPKKFFEDLNYTLTPIKHNNKMISSGVGFQMTTRLNTLKYKVLDFGSLLIHNGNDVSVMHPEIRKKQPLIGKPYINDIILSIIIPTYKNTKYIDDCLKSIDTNSCEVLIGIDGCIETKKYFENAEQINNVKVFYFNQNLGPYSIKNTLATIATSNNLLFFDSDDIMNPNMIDTILNGLDRYVCVKPKFEEFGGKSLKGTTFGEGVFGIRKDIFLSMNGFEPWKMAADSDFMGRLYKKRVSILHTPQILFKRRVHPESLTNRKDTGMHSPLRAHYARLSKNKKGDGNPVELHTRDYIEINISNDLEVNSVPQKEKNSVLNLLNRVQQPVIVKEKKEVNYEEVNKVIYNKTQNKKPTKKGENTLMNKNLNVRKKIFNSFNNNRNLGGKI